MITGFLLRNPFLVIAGIAGVGGYIAYRNGKIARFSTSSDKKDPGMGYPGEATNDINALYPSFRAKVMVLIGQLRSGQGPSGENWDVEILETWRSPERQAFYKSKGWSTVDYGFHTVTGPNGEPESLAIDMKADPYDWNAPADHSDTKKLAQFYSDIAALAPKLGLSSGASWSRKDPKWAKYGIGWDPGHVEPAGISLTQVRRGARPK